jgi:branched-chain amino acid transport system permease protein
MKYPQIYPYTGMIPGLKAFIAAVVGGIGSIPGAMLGGFILGVAEIMIVAFLPALAGYRDAIAYIILIVILLVKPNGLLGVEIGEKV